MTLTETDWNIRHFVYETLASTGRAPGSHAIAVQLGISASAARKALQRLHEAHALVLRAGSDEILMANPLSAAPTDYRVLVGDAALYANCAWDSLGIPAMLGADARVEARHPLDGEIIKYGVAGGKLTGDCTGLCISRCPFASGTRISSIPELQFCSSGRKRKSTIGVGGSGVRAAPP